jgi:DNA-binding transcriptional ArsR family regulator
MVSGSSDLSLPASMAPVFAALGDPVRLAVVRRLGQGGPLPTSELKAQAGGVTRQGLTKHLRVLEEAGLVESARQGRDRQWRLQPGQVEALRQYLDLISAQWDARLARLRALTENGG